MIQGSAGPEVLSGGGMHKPTPIGDVVPLSVATGKTAPSLRLEVRAATKDVHDRLHHHAGFAAIQDATICLADYEALIVRLYGFYLPFEAAMAIDPERSTWLAGDLAALGHKRPLHALPMCQHLPRLDSAYLRLGALYVAEGSALGGRELARGLDPLLGKDVTHGRRFFIGRGASTGESWRSYLAHIALASSEPFARAEVIRGATRTFAAFENWLNGWSTSSYV
jgi:heme oxygenase